MTKLAHTPSHNEAAWWLFDNGEVASKIEADRKVSFMTEAQFSMLQTRIHRAERGGEA